MLFEYVSSQHGLTCSKCKSFSCSFCLAMIIERATKERLHDQWSQIVNRFLVDGIIPSNFIGHCCEWDVQLATNVSTATSPRRFDGYLFLPEYQLLIDSNFGNVDIHAFGADAKYSLSPVWHGVVDEHTAIEAAERNLYPDGTAAKISEFCTLQFIMNGQKIKVCHPCT